MQEGGCSIGLAAQQSTLLAPHSSFSLDNVFAVMKAMGVSLKNSG